MVTVCVRSKSVKRAGMQITLALKIWGSYDDQRFKLL